MGTTSPTKQIMLENCTIDRKIIIFYRNFSVDRTYITCIHYICS